MKRIYWRPRQVSRPILMFIALMSLVGLLAVEQFKVTVQQSDYDAKIEAARLAQSAMAAIREYKIGKGMEVDLDTDLTDSGLIGKLMTPVTSDPGLLRSKQTTVNPNFAAVVVEMLREAGVRQGDPIAIGFSGSFPAMNICVLAAAKALGLKPIVISSGAASQWGANDPELLWIDMEKLLADEGIFPYRSVAASLGGIEDRGLGMSDEGLKKIGEAIERNKLPLIATSTFTENIDKRMAIYYEKAEGRPIRAYINVGGGTISVGTAVGKRLFRPGLNLQPPRGISSVDAIMARFITSGVPVIHFVQMTDLAAEYGLPVAPTKMPVVGEGQIFVKRQHSRWLAGGILAAILISLYAFVRSDLGFRILQPHTTKLDAAGPMEQMV